MYEKGITLQSCEVGDTFYLSLAQGLTDVKYICALRDVLAEHQTLHSPKT